MIWRYPNISKKVNCNMAKKLATYLAGIWFMQIAFGICIFWQLGYYRKLLLPWSFFGRCIHIGTRLYIRRKNWSWRFLDESVAYCCSACFCVVFYTTIQDVSQAIMAWFFSTLSLSNTFIIVMKIRGWEEKRVWCPAFQIIFDIRHAAILLSIVLIWRTISPTQPSLGRPDKNK